MSEAKFTEGPWQSQGDFDMESVCRIIGAIDGPDDGRFHYKLVCEIDPDGSQDTAEQYANARLIAAAPDLYEALSGAISLLEMASINSDAFGGEDDPEYIASKAAWDRDLDSFRSALLLANTGGKENG